MRYSPRHAQRAALAGALPDSRRYEVHRRSAAWTAWRMARGVIAMLALVAGVAGVPWALLQFTRWPITGLPTWAQIADFPVALINQDSTIVAIFTVGLWAAWTVFALCVLVEVVGEIRGIRTAHLRVAGPFQRLAQSLVASVAMTFGSLGSLAAHTPSGTATSVPAITATAGSMPESAGSVPGGPGPSDPGEQAIAWMTVTVEHGDTPWDLAERYYNDGTHWLRLWDDNQHHLQPDGRTWHNQADPIEPGWQLQVRSSEAHGTTAENTPVDARPSAPTATAPPTEGVEVTAQPGDNLWGLSEDHLAATLGRPPAPDEVAPYWLDVVEANRDRLSEIDNPDLIYPGQTFVLPTADDALTVDTPAPAPTHAPPPTEEADEADAAPPAVPEQTTSTTAPPSTTSSTESPTTTQEQQEPTTRSPSETSPTNEPETEDNSDDLLVLGAIGTVAGLSLAVGLTQAIRKRRRRRNHRHPNTTPRPSANPELHRELVAAADEDTHSLLHRALSHLATALLEGGAKSRPRIVQHSTEHLDALLDIPVQAAAQGWEHQADGAVWSCDPAHLPDGIPDHPVTNPLLVTLGQPDEGGQLYIDLEAEGIVSLVGDTAVAQDVARAIVTELAHSPAADAAQVMVVGTFAGRSLDRLDRVTTVDTWATAAASLRAWADQSHDALEFNGWPNAFIARGLGTDHDALVPLLVVTDDLPPDAVGDLAHLASNTPLAVAVLVIGDVPIDSTVIVCTPDHLSLPQLGLVCTPQTLDDEHLEAILELLDDAEDPAGEQLQLIPDTPRAWGGDANNDPAIHTTDQSNGGSYHDPPYDVLVRLLGDIAIEGATNTKPTPKQTAVIAYVAIHRTVTLDRICDALWSEPTPSRRRRIINTVSAARSAIGGEHLPIASDATYRAGPHLLTDLELLNRRLAAAPNQPRELAIQTLRSALDLVRGPIFTYPSALAPSYAWISTENWISTWELKIAALARELANLCMTSGDTQQAVDVAQQAQRIVPADSGLTELLMRAHAANGDRVAVQRVYQAHVEALQQLDLDDPAESTVELYEELRSTRTA